MDFHHEVGNNATLARWLKPEDAAYFGDTRATLSARFDLEAVFLDLPTGA